MSDLVIKRLPRRLAFPALNAAVVLMLVFLIAVPIMSHFVERSEAISELSIQLAHVHSIKWTEKKLMEKATHFGDPFLAGREERIASADLQANLKAMAANSGAGFLGIRGLPGARFQGLRMVAVSLEIEGPLRSVEKLIRSIESQTPYLFVTAAILRRSADAEEVIRAELKVRGAIHDLAPGETVPPNSVEGDGE
jgi:general secretion pathway protein M